MRPGEWTDDQRRIQHLRAVVPGLSRRVPLSRGAAVFRCRLVDSRTQLSAAILVGSCIIGAGLYFGLRERDDPGDIGSVNAVARPSSAAGAASKSNRAAGSPERSTPPWAGEGEGPRTGFDVPTPQPPEFAAEEPPGDSPPVLVLPQTPLQKAAVTAFDAIREDVVRACWKPSGEDPPTASLLLSLSLDPQGKVVGRGVHQAGAEHVGLGTCVTRQLSSLQIEGTGARVRIDVNVELP